MTHVPSWIRRARQSWRHTGRERPAFAVEPAPGQESVWDYPRPPAIVPDARDVVVQAQGREIARSTRSVRVLETASPPTFYLPPADVCLELLTPAPGRSLCEWKGEARFWCLSGGTGMPVGWSYPDPFPDFEALRDYLAFYPGRVECLVAGVRVHPQPGEFYGGWITPELVGPFKGDHGTESW